MKRYRVLLLSIGGLLIALLAAVYLSLGDYPRIVRSAYYRNPVYAGRAFGAKYFGKKRFSSEAALARVKQAGLVPAGKPKFLYLLPEPKWEIDKPISARYFGMICKFAVITRETAFWEIPVNGGRALVEANRGRVIYFKYEYDTLAEGLPKYHDAGPGR